MNYRPAMVEKSIGRKIYRLVFWCVTDILTTFAGIIIIRITMKRFITLSAVLASVVASAQATPSKGAAQLNLAAGFSDRGLPFEIGVDYGIGNDISVGGAVNYLSDTTTVYQVKRTYTAIGVFARGNYHFNRILKLPKELDLYAGLSLGYVSWSYRASVSNEIGVNYSDSNSTPLGFSGQFGGRYFFTNNWALNLEFGGGNTFNGGKIGVTYRF